MSSAPTPEEKRILSQIDLAEAAAAKQERTNAKKRQTLKKLHDDILSGDPTRKKKALLLWNIMNKRIDWTKLRRPD
jgi:hypothetical protein